MRTPIFAFLLALAACAGTLERPPDDFVRAAESWEGLSAGAMMTRWGPPDAIDDGKATWRLDRRSVRCIDAARRQAPFGGFMSYTSRECSPPPLRHKCVVTARFDALKEIIEVNTSSFRCAEVYEHYIRILDSGYPFNLYKYGDTGENGYAEEARSLR